MLESISERKRLSDENKNLKSENSLLSSFKNNVEVYHSNLFCKICKYLTREQMETIEVNLYTNLFQWYATQLLVDFSKSDGDPSLTDINVECLSEAKRLGLELVENNGEYYYSTNMTIK